MEKSTAIQILELLSHKIETDQIDLGSLLFQKEIKSEHIVALSMAIDSLREIDKHNGKHYLELPFQPGEKVYICATVDWELGIIPATIWDMTAYYDQKAKEFYWMFNVDHEYVHSKNNPALVINRYNFTEEELAKTKEEAIQKWNNRALQVEAKRKINR